MGAGRPDGEKESCSAGELLGSPDGDLYMGEGRPDGVKVSFSAWARQHEGAGKV